MKLVKVNWKFKIAIDKTFGIGYRTKRHFGIVWFWHFVPVGFSLRRV